MKCLFLFFIFLFPVFLQAQETDSEAQRMETSVNFGAKAGFTSAMMLIDQLEIGEASINEIQNNYKLGYFGSFFMRINFDRHFLQPELSYNINRSKISFTYPQEEITESTSQHTASISSKLYSIELPIIYGYNFIKEGPYSMAAFGGPKLRYLWKKHCQMTFENFEQENIHEQLYPLNLSFTMGVAVTISRVFFDFRYDIGLHNICRKVGYDSAENPTVPSIQFKHKENALSFSLGVFF